MRKKLLVGILVGVMAMGTLAGCGGSDNGGGAEGDSTVANSGSGGGAEGGAVEGAEVTLIMSSRDEFLSTLEAGAQAAAKEVGIKLTSQDAQNDQARVLQYVETAKNNGNAAVIVNLVDADAAEQDRKSVV